LHGLPSGQVLYPAELAHFNVVWGGCFVVHGL
jgi:hypothetical protein